MMKRAESLMNEALRVRIGLIRNCMDVIELCLNDNLPLAKVLVEMTVDNVVVLAEEIQEDVDKREIT